MPLKNDFEKIREKCALHGFTAERVAEQEKRRTIVVYSVKDATGRVVYSCMEFFDFYRWYVRNLASAEEKRSHQNCLMR